MFFKISWDTDFDTLMMHLWGKYGKKLFTLDGIGEQMDLNRFAQKFFNTGETTADVSIDANANVAAKTGIEFNFEMSKPLKRYNSYYLLWKELNKHYGLETANRIIERQLIGDIYINDFTDICNPYCFNYSTYDIACNGLNGISKRLHIVPPQSLDTFLRQVEQFMVVAANSTLGATGLADLLIVASKYVDKIQGTGRDGHVIIIDVETYIREKLTEFVYTVNWEFRGNQSPFTNVSLYDNTFLQSLCPDYGAKPATVKLLQRIYTEVMNAEMERSPITFPVTTACFCRDEHGEIKDKDFLHFIAEANKKFAFINFYNGETSTLSSCCRMRSNTDNPYFNSFGAGSTKIGSLGVVTANLPRIAVLSDGDISEFCNKLHTVFCDAQKINACKRRLIQKRIDLGAAPLYIHDYMELKRQYSTFGIVGLHEALQILGLDILSKDGQEYALHVLECINAWIADAEREEKAPHNVEQVPAETSAVKLAAKDTYLGYNVLKAPLYSNQFIPLIVPADMQDRLRLQGLFDKHLSGGAIAHINVGEPIENTETMVALMEYAARVGVVYWAINYKLNCCDQKHTWVGTEICPKCGQHWTSQITRVVGFFTTVKNWHPVRRESDWPKRQFYSNAEAEQATIQTTTDESVPPDMQLNSLWVSNCNEVSNEHCGDGGECKASRFGNLPRWLQRVLSWVS